MNSIRRDTRSFDYVLLALVVALALFGLLMVGSVTGLGNGNFSGVFVNQLIFLVTGLVILLLMAFINYEFISKFYIPIYIVNIALLIIVLFMPDTRGVSRWIGMEIGGFEFGIQPSEFAKIFMIIVLAKVVDKYKDKINSFLVLGVIFAATTLPVVLINMQPSFSASAVSIVIMLAILYAGRISYKYVVVVTLVVVPTLLFFFIDLHAEYPVLIDNILTPWQQDRIWNFLYPEYGDGWGIWQNEQAIRAMSSGLLTGRGLFNNPVPDIPEATNDFIFSVIGAEFGFIGSVGVLLIALLIVLRCLIIAQRSEVFLGKLIATGVAATIAFQTFTHVAINAWLLPNTGMNLPFVSSGGSSLWVFMAMIGLVLNVGMTREYSMFENMGHSYE